MISMTLEIIFFVIYVITGLLLLLWMSSFEYTIYRIQHRFPKYYKAIGSPNLKTDITGGIKITYKLLKQLYKELPNSFPKDNICITLAYVYKYSIRLFYISLIASSVATIVILVR